MRRSVIFTIFEKVGKNLYSGWIFFLYAHPPKYQTFKQQPALKHLLTLNILLLPMNYISQHQEHIGINTYPAGYRYQNTTGDVNYIV